VFQISALLQQVNDVLNNESHIAQGRSTIFETAANAQRPRDFPQKPKLEKSISQYNALKLTSAKCYYFL
jgi:hypothetical protein